MDYLVEPASLHPYRLKQKTYILKDNICVALAGDVSSLQVFLRDLRYFCSSRTVVSNRDMASFLTNYRLDKKGTGVSFLILVSERLTDEYQLGIFKRGHWTELSTEVFGEVIAAGSGAETLFEGLKREVNFSTGYPDDSLDKGDSKSCYPNRFAVG